jgi:hypothetical protein
MTPNTPVVTQCYRERHSMQQAITRHNGLVFYGLATASFLESAVPLHATALLGVFAGDQGVRHWIEQSWWPAKSAHARETRACVEMLWPEFDWSAAYGEFYESYRPLVTEGRVGRSPAREALACGRMRRPVPPHSTAASPRLSMIRS